MNTPPPNDRSMPGKADPGAAAVERFWRSLGEARGQVPHEPEDEHGHDHPHAHPQGKRALPVVSSPSIEAAAAAAEARMEEQTARWLGRRGFFQIMGGGIAVTALAACTRQPPEAIVPYVKGPEDMVMGKPLFFASAALLGGVATGVLVESHEGHPTKIEGNPEHPTSLGASDVWGQASILDLYDPDRSQTVTHLGEIAAWGSFASALQVEIATMRSRRGKGLTLLTGAVTSPSLHAQIRALLDALPLARWRWWEPVSRAPAREGARIALGDDLEPRYRFDEAEVIVSLDADFLSPAEGSLSDVRAFAQGRRLGADGRPMSRLYAVECTPGLAGAAADHRLAVRPSHLDAVAWVLAGLLGVALPAGPKPEIGPTEQKWLEAAARDLQKHRGRCLVVAGERQSARVHALANAMNDALGNVGRTVSYIEPVVFGPADPVAQMRELAADLDKGEVDLLVIVGSNPVYTAPADLAFAEKMKKARLRVHLGLYQDETAALCHWHVPETHPLEHWSDARSADGTITLVQPLIEPLYNGKSAHELLAALSDKPDKKGYDVVRDHHRTSWPDDRFEAGFREALHLGFLAKSARPARTPALRPLPDLAPPRPAGGEGYDLLFRPDSSAYDGRFANNAWLQELPRLLTKLVWDNAVLVAPATAAEMGVEQGDVIEIGHRGATVKAPVWVMPGQPPRTLTVHLGYGRTRGGKVARGIGFDAYRLRTADEPWTATGATAKKTGDTHELVTTQTQPTMAGRDIVRSAAAPAYAAALGKPSHHEREEATLAAFGVHEHGERMSLYPRKSYPGYSWGMTIDLNACVGCNACVVACQSENNIPVVGKEETKRGRAMHWIRIDRYYEGSPDDPRTHFMPVPCMQCENAPCEAVCPVAATVHHPEGLNDMVYNRCVGTKYCSNNCPYKVRRYNFFGYSKEALGPFDPSPTVLTLMRNPDVTVRSYGVMEKCTYCVQRINHARIDAKLGDRKIRDGEVMTACQAACPARAISFGDMNDPHSEVARRKAEPRNYSLLEDLNTLPHTTYLGDLENPNPELGRT